MAKELKIQFSLLFLSVNFIFASCTTMGINTYEKAYFNGKPESTLTKYFGNDMEEVFETGEFDKVIYCNNETITAEMMKRNVKTYKVANTEKLWDFSYHKWSDGCITSDYRHYDYSSGRHNNNIGEVNSQIDFFNTQVKRLGCIDQAYQQDYINKSNIGDVFYFSYYGNLNKAFYESSTQYSQGGTYYIYSCIIWETEIIAKEEVQIEKAVAWTYYGNSGVYYDENGNIISEEKALALLENYKKQGYEANGKTTGLSLTAYIKDGKIVKVE